MANRLPGTFENVRAAFGRRRERSTHAIVYQKVRGADGPAAPGTEFAAPTWLFWVLLAAALAVCGAPVGAASTTPMAAALSLPLLVPEVRATARSGAGMRARSVATARWTALVSRCAQRA